MAYQKDLSVRVSCKIDGVDFRSLRLILVRRKGFVCIFALAGDRQK